MRTRSRNWMLGVMVLAVVGIAICIESRAQPTYHGHKLSYWIDQLPGAQRTGRGIYLGDLEDSPDVKKNPEEVARAIRAIGANALPYLERELNAQDRLGEKTQAASDWMKV